MFDASTQILFLMAIPLTGAFLIGGYLIYAISSRAKKGKMKHGSQAARSTQSSYYSQSGPGPTSPASQADDLNTDILFDHKRPSAFAGAGSAPPDPNLAVNNLAEPGQAGISPQPLEQAGVERPAEPSSAEPVELLRLLRDPHSGDLLIQIGDSRYAKLTEVANKKIGQYILKLTAHLLAFTNGMIVTEAGLKSVYNPKVGETPQPIAPPPPAVTARNNASQPAPPRPQPGPNAEAAFMDSLHSRGGPTEPAPASGGLFGRPKPASSLPTMLPALNLAKEINDIVQNRLMYSPPAGNPKIEIVSAPDGGIRINVNGVFYGSVDEVPDPEAKALIQASIKQWEKS